MEKTTTAFICLLFFSISSFSKNKEADKLAALSDSSLTKQTVSNQSQGGSSWKEFFKISSEKDLASKPKLGGFFIGDYSYYSNGEKDAMAGFSIRCVRLYLDGTLLKDFIYRVQMEVAGAPGVDKGPRLLDAYLEWAKHPYFKIKIGQYKRPFTFENPLSLWTVGYGAYSQATIKLSGMSDRVGEHSSSGRDAGLQFQGDLFPVGRDGHRFFHYQIGVFNGQGLNHNDVNRNKDLIGGIWIAPLKDLRIGTFGWTGRYGATLANLGKQKVNRNRLSVGVDYESDWVFRSEYITSEGGKISDDITYKYAANKADAWYAMIGVPATSKLKIYGKWDVYRDEKTDDTKSSVYAVAFNYKLMKDLMFQLTYAFNQARSAKYTSTGARSVSESNYNQITLQTYIRF